MARFLIAAATMATAAGPAGTAAVAAPSILPGEWENSSSVQMQTMPNMPPQVAEMMRSRMGKPIVVRSCITPEQAARGPVARAPDSKCKLNNISYGGGRMTTEMLCNQDGQVTRIKMSGNYSPTSYEMNGQMSSAGGRAGPMAMTMHVTGKRISPICSAASK